ncbi:MAG: hypothetical protein KGI68_01510 [Alphaproteobacteria bacterium]|nr:hypothetical protein [Alphaproteobacteria bacterium]MDE1986129.1 hypothetical protein [Alphaproteobacteria bacterium]MDE2162876.1 hypothetical protein [Alphaproteobacteria bacterium]MDE2265339.1 hypothetical protein [Alphaproteobacteria bacterium]
MKTVDDVRKAVENLSQDELADFRSWFVEYDAAFFVPAAKHKLTNGKLDKLAEQAIKDLSAGRVRKA